MAARPALEIRTDAELKPPERDQLDRAGLLDRASVEAWTATGSNHENGYATHGVFRYFGKFPPPIASHLVAAHTRPGDLVSDPMCGSGTTGVECLLAGRRCELRDVNPLSVLLARVKTRRVARKALDDALGRIRNRYRPRARGFEPVGLRNPEHWFLPATARSLRGLKAAVEEEESPAVRDVFQAAFLASVRQVSRATTQQGRLFLDAASARPDAWDTFARRAARAIQAIADLPRAAGIKVAQHDLRVALTNGALGKAALVIIHPPYFNAYRYSRINSLELAWLGCQPAEVRPSEVREFFKVGKPEKLSQYLDDMHTALVNAAKLSRPGGTVALMIGDTILRGEHLPVTRRLLDRLAGSGLALRKIALRVPRHSEASWVASQRRDAGRLGVPLCDYVLVFSRTRAEG